MLHLSRETTTHGKTRSQVNLRHKIILMETNGFQKLILNTMWLNYRSNPCVSLIKQRYTPGISFTAHFLSHALPVLYFPPNMSLQGFSQALMREICFHWSWQAHASTPHHGRQESRKLPVSGKHGAHAESHMRCFYRSGQTTKTSPARTQTCAFSRVIFISYSALWVCFKAASL